MKRNWGQVGRSWGQVGPSWAQVGPAWDQNVAKMVSREACGLVNDGSRSSSRQKWSKCVSSHETQCQRAIGHLVLASHLNQVGAKLAQVGRSVAGVAFSDWGWCNVWGSFWTRYGEEPENAIGVTFFKGGCFYGCFMVALWLLYGRQRHDFVGGRVYINME